MSREIIEFVKTLLSALVGAGLTLAVIAKFGQSWFFKNLDAKYAFKLAEKNNSLKSDLESKKNELNKELQIEVTHFKSQLEVLGGQQSKFLEKKINSILLLNQHHYLAVKSIKEYTDTTHHCVDEAVSYFFCQFEDGMSEKLSDYGVYRRIHEERLPSFEKSARLSFDKYAECLALNMPILPKELVREEMAIIDSLRKTLEDASMAFSRAMSFTQYIVQPEACETTAEECMNDLKEEARNAHACQEFLGELSNQLFEKSIRSGDLIEKLLKHNSKN